MNKIITLNQLVQFLVGQKLEFSLNYSETSGKYGLSLILGNREYLIYDDSPLEEYDEVIQDVKCWFTVETYQVNYKVWRKDVHSYETFFHYNLSPDDCEILVRDYRSGPFTSIDVISETSGEILYSIYQSTELEDRYNR
jgi:hypothetical protein